MASALTVLLLGCWLAGWSRVSGKGSYPKPSISVSPGGVIPVGGKVTIRCRHQGLNMRFLLYKDGAEKEKIYTDPAGSEAEFPITSARRDHGGSYTCRYSNTTGHTAYSEPSDPVQIIVADPSFPRPSISLSPTGVIAPGADVTIRCQGQRWDVRFFLHKAGDLNPQQHMDPAGDGVEFRIPSVGRQHGGNYSCSYRPQSQPFISSQPSDPVELVVSERNLMTWPIIAGVSAAAAVLLLLVAFVGFRKTRARRGAAQRPSSSSLMEALNAPAQQDSTYASINKGKQPQTPPQEPEPSDNGLTYAELNHQPLQVKRGGPASAPEPAQPSVYAAINMSRGTPQ